MKNEVQFFENEELGQVRVITIDDEPWFVLSDICKVLELSNPTVVANRIDDDERSKFDLGRQGKATIINESGLYAVILRSDKPQAKLFRKWITSEVLPSIRKNGSYSIQEKPDSYMIEDPIARAKRWIEEQEEKKALENKIEEQKPLVEYAEQIQVSDDVIDMGTMAKIVSKRGINIGRNTLFAFLRDRKILNRNNVPYATYMAQDWFEVEENTFRMYDGTVGLSKTTRVTPKGQMAIINQLKKYYMK